jgi:hypothetical protein
MLFYTTSISIEMKRRVRPVNRNVQIYHKGLKLLFSISNRLTIRYTSVHFPVLVNIKKKSTET